MQTPLQMGSDSHTAVIYFNERRAAGGVTSVGSRAMNCHPCTRLHALSLPEPKCLQLFATGQTVVKPTVVLAGMKWVSDAVSTVTKCRSPGISGSGLRPHRYASDGCCPSVTAIRDKSKSSLFSVCRSD